MKCTICGKPIRLTPTARDRAAKYGGVPSDYSRLFTEHSACLLGKREREARDLMKKLNGGTV